MDDENLVVSYLLSVCVCVDFTLNIFKWNDAWKSIQYQLPHVSYLNHSNTI